MNAGFYVSMFVLLLCVADVIVIGLSYINGRRIRRGKRPLTFLDIHELDDAEPRA